MAATRSVEPDDVGEHQGGEHPRMIGGHAGAGQELLNLINNDGCDR